MREAVTTHAQGWPTSRAEFRPLLGILSQNAGLSLAIRANPGCGTHLGGRYNYEGRTATCTPPTSAALFYI
jgi:hypothetical protein